MIFNINYITKKLLDNEVSLVHGITFKILFFAFVLVPNIGFFAEFVDGLNEVE